MNYLKRLVLGLSAPLAGVSICVVCLTASFAGSPKPPAVPAKIDIQVAPSPLTAGGEAQVTVRLQPIDGVQINRYPKIKFEMPEREGLVAPASVAVGNDAPPHPDRMNENYFGTVDPLELNLEIAGDAARGTHEVQAKLTYFYCVKASGFCAPKRVQVPVTLNVR